MALSVPAAQQKKLLVIVLAALGILVIFILRTAAGHGGGSVACPAQDELKSFLSAKAAGIKQWNAFKEIYSFEVDGYQKKVGVYTISFTPGYVNCVKGAPAGFKCDRRDPIFSISSSDGSGGGVLEAHEITVDAESFGIVGQIMCTRG